MDRCAIFVDAGYLYAAGGSLCCNTRARKSLDLDPSGFNQLVVNVAKGCCPAPVLRTYWYDGAKNGIPTTTQQRIAALANVKLRLGRLNTKNQQKGVDALIYRDIMTLASERAVTDAFLVSGDEDLREGVKAAQDRGVRVILVGIESKDGFNQSRELVEEADELVTLTKTDLAHIIRLRPSPRTVGTSAAEVNPILPLQSTPGVVSASPAAAGEDYAREWVTNATSAEIRSLVGVYPRIPRQLDGELLRFVEGAIGRSLFKDDQAHREVRRAFWSVVRQATADLPANS